MNIDSLRNLLEEVKSGVVPVDDALSKLRIFPYIDMDFARIDTHRPIRQGFPEVIFGLGKTAEQIVAIAQKLMQTQQNILITKIDPDKAQAVTSVLSQFTYHASAQSLLLMQDMTIRGKGTVGVVSAGTSDHPISEEACVTLESMGNEYFRLYDVGVAGIHRLFGSIEKLHTARVLIVVAGMEGALPSVIGGLVSCPVIAVPTSVGYGSSFKGVSALLGMLNSCAANVTVVNIDNGFGAGFVASLINRI